ncbi:probable transcription factor At1g61730 [Humulus lupulus]|uniref:probable transcription factor At1g61730 n=1 Tax=Humulus lupulus TaxID=3486 RepID=UPI002B40A21F|nr:probable transcription factor At1g61730 [Humulus lupulus]
MKSFYVDEKTYCDDFDEYYSKYYESDSETDIGSDSTYNIGPEKATANSSGSKRSRNSKRSEESNSKNKKKKNNNRRWSDEDEITLLQGFIDYSKQENNSIDIGGFFLFIRKSFITSIPGLTKKQLSDKLRRLKKKFKDNQPNYHLQPPATHHDRKVFDLSNIIWGRDDKKDMAMNDSDQGKVDDDDDDGVVVSDDYDVVILLPESLDDYLCDHGVRLDWLEDEDVKKLEKSWKKVKEYEHKYVIRKSTLDITMNRLKLQLTKLVDD